MQMNPLVIVRVSMALENRIRADVQKMQDAWKGISEAANNAEDVEACRQAMVASMRKMRAALESLDEGMRQGLRDLGEKDAES